MSDARPSHPRPAEGPARDLPGAAQRVFIIGLDGATFDVLDPMVDRGIMPRLRVFLAEGTAGVLRSTVPPITPAAWTTFMTGKSPGTHGIIDFERYDVRTNRLTLNTTNCLQHVRTIWQVLGDKGFRVGCIGVPMTYPPTSVNGFLISGFGTPDTDCEFTYPADIRDDVLRVCPDLGFGSRWQRKLFGRDDQFAQNLNVVKQSFHHGYELARHFGDRFGWDALMVVLKLVDNLQHKTWKYLDPRWAGRYPKRAAMVAECFAELDTVFGQMVDYAEQNNAAVFVMSDHGHGSLEGQAQPNLMLKDWGYLALKPGGQLAPRIQKRLRRLMGKKHSKFATASFSIERDLAVDFTRTRACVMHAGMNGFLYLNLAGRQKTGIVRPDGYETLRDELRQRLLDVTTVDPTGKTIHVFPEVHKPEELYGCPRDGREWLPDLLLVPHDALAVVRKIRGRSPVRWLPERQIEGTHRSNGIFAARGPGVAAGRRLDADIIDSTPTILAMLGVRIPDDMEGRIIDGVFDPPIEHATEAVPKTASAGHVQEAYTEDEVRAITERLVDLGYLE